MSDGTRLCPICGYAWFGGMCLHTYVDVFDYANDVGRQLARAKVTLKRIPHNVNHSKHGQCLGCLADEALVDMALGNRK